jgi:drug/metabolite transporter (DMT)-like permease
MVKKASRAAPELSNAVLFSTPVLIWGSTWLAIRYQLGSVDPLLSVAYRFLAAGALMLAYCWFRGVALRLGASAHAFVALQGLFLFGINYWLVYESERWLPSGLVAVVFSGLMFANALNGWVFLGNPIRSRVLLGGVLGLGGVTAIFGEDLLQFSVTNESLGALGLALGSVYLASLGNTLSARNQRAGMTVLQTNTLGMLYGGAAMMLVSVGLGKPFALDLSFSYLASFVYLTIFGSIVAFTCFLTLLGRIGADKAAYVALLMPVIALALTTLFEGYRWTFSAAIGVVLVLLGNFLALRK